MVVFKKHHKQGHIKKLCLGGMPMSCDMAVSRFVEVCVDVYA